MFRPVAAFRPRLLLALVLAAWSGTAVSAEWRRLDADGFTVVGDVSEKRLQQVAAEITRFRATVGKFMSTGLPAQQLPVQVYAVSRGTWKNYLQPRPDLAGYFHPDPFGADIVLDGEGDFDNSRSIIYHEYTHYFLHINDPFPYPLWFDEGVAQLMETMRASGDRIYAARLPPRGWLDTGPKWLPLSRVLAANHESPEYVQHQVMDQFYLESLLLTHYLIIGAPPGRSSQLNRFLERQVVGKLDPDAASVAAFGIPLATLEQEVIQYYRKGDFLAMIQRDPVPGKPRYPVTGLTDAEGWDEVGHVMLRVGVDPAKAGQVFRTLLEGNPGNRRAVAGLALALERQGKPADADSLLVQLRASATPAGLPDRYCGMIYGDRLRALADKGVGSEVRTHANECFVAARRADPGDLRALIGLADLAADDPVATRDLIGPLTAAMEQHPENEFLALSTSRALWLLGRRDESVACLKRAIERTRDVDLRSSLVAAYRELGKAAATR